MNNHNTQTNLVVEINVGLGMIVWWWTTHEEIKQHSKCPVGTRSVSWMVSDMVTNTMDVMNDNVPNDHGSIMLEEAAMLRHMGLQLLDMLQRVKHVLDNFGSVMVGKCAQMVVAECVLPRINGTQCRMFHQLQMTNVCVLWKFFFGRRWCIVVLCLSDKMSHV